MKQTFFKRTLSGVLSLACVLSGTAFAGMTALNAEEPIEAQAASSESPQFSWDNASVYFLLTDRFCNGDTSNDHSYGRGLNQSGQAVSYDTLGAFQGGDFAGITKKINEGYFNDLGVNAIWLSAPYEQIHGYCVGGDGDSFAHYSYHGYYVLDYTESDKNFGTKQEFKTLVDTAHEHGIRIVMDVVMNHAGYQTLQDMSEYGFGSLKSGWESYYYAHQNINNGSYHGYIGYDDNTKSDWAKWWGSNWVRCGLPGYTKGSGDVEGCLADLPDFKTGDTSLTGLPQILISKWGKEGTLEEKEKKYKEDTVSGYISTWLAEWVSEFGVDGFRCDTAKHVEMSAWKKLKDKCVAALKQWRQNNPSAPGADWTDDFWMTGEHFGHKVGKSEYFTSGAFDSMINFEFAPAAASSAIPSAGAVDEVYNRYANQINTDPQLNALTYLASHDTTLIECDRIFAGSFLLMCPGGIQIYYGDETSRPYDTNPKAMKDPGAGHQTRKFMNWDSIDNNVLSHWKKVGQFRNNHLAVGAGSNTTLSSYSSSTGLTFARTYSKGDIDDKIVATLFAPANTSLTIDVSSVWSDGIEITNFYDGTTCKVSGGKVTFNTGAHGTILMQEPQGKKGKVNITHINKDTGATIKTETMQGLIGDSYTVQPLSQDGFKLSSTSGSTTGTYSETEATVKFYYTFDSDNYAYVVTKYVDSDSGAEIADSVTETKKIGTSYTTTAATIKNYEVDTVPSNATGTVKSGTTTVTYKYKYVEPDNLIVHYYQAASWPAMYIYAYDESTSETKKYTGDWPGTKMTSDGNNWYSYSVDEAESAQVIFNSGSDANKDPAGNLAPGYQASGEVWIKDAKVYPTGKVSVKYTATDGKVLGSEILKGMADGTNSYTTTAKTFDGYELSSTPSNATGKYTEGTTTVNYVYKSTAVDVLPTGVTLNKTSLSLTTGNSSTLTATVAPSNATDKTVTWKSSNTAVATVSNGTVKAVKAGTAKITVTTNTGSYTATCNVTVTDPAATLKNNSTVSADLVNIGTTVTITGKASGGTAPYKYAFYYKKSSASSYTTIGTAFGTATTATFKATTEDVYNVKVVVKDNDGNTATFTTSVEAMDLGGEVTDLSNTSTISSTKVTTGTTVKITGKATGGTTPYKFAYYYKRSTNTKWNVLGTEFGSATTATFTPTAEAKYDVKVIVKDADSETQTKTFTVTVSGDTNTLTNTSTIVSTKAQIGDDVRVTGSAKGGSGSYKYAFYFKRSTNTKWNKMGTEFGTATYATLIPTAAAEYDVKVVVKDSKNVTAEKTFKVTSVKSMALTNVSVINTDTNVAVKKTVTFSGRTVGGSKPVSYIFYFKRSANSKWNKLSYGNSKGTYAKFTPTAAASYDLKSIAIDENGTTSSKIITITAS